MVVIGFCQMGYYIYDIDIKFHVDMDFNMICCWGGGLAERPKFYHYCDIYGLLVVTLFLSPCVCVVSVINYRG